jgi:hypothetical protein
MQFANSALLGFVKGAVAALSATVNAQLQTSSQHVTH